MIKTSPSLEPAGLHKVKLQRQNREAGELMQHLLTERGIATQEPLDVPKVELGQLFDGSDLRVDEPFLLLWPDALDLKKLIVAALPDASLDAAENIESDADTSTILTVTEYINRAAQCSFEYLVHALSLTVQFVPRLGG